MIRVVVASLLVMFGPEVEPGTREERLDQLFAELAAAPDEAEARFVAEAIEATWGASGDASADLLALRASRATAAGDLTLARRLIDGALELEPDFADAWAQSASIAMAADEMSVALEHINRALELEPRHYRALFVLGVILDRLEEEEGAYEAFQDVLEIYPLHPQAAGMASEVEREALGRDL